MKSPAIVKTVVFVLLALAAGWLAPPIGAQDKSQLTAEVAIVSDYVIRGFSRTAAEPAVQAGFGYRHRSGLIVGAWASTVQFDYDEFFAENTREVELQVFAGYSTTLRRGWTGSALFVRYQYPDVDQAVDKSYHEFNVSLYYRDLFSVAMAYSPGFLGGADSGLFVEISGRYPLAYGLDLSVGIGRAEVELGTADGYGYGHVAIGRSFGRVSTSLGYYHSNAVSFPRWGDVADDNWAFVVSTQLPWKRRD